MSGKSYQTNAQQSSQLFVKIEEFFDKERAPLLSAKKGGEGREWKQMGDKPRFWTGGGGAGKNGEKSNRAICQISLTGEGMRCAVPGGGVLQNVPYSRKTSHREVFLGSSNR